MIELLEKENRFVAVVGFSGSGKSSLVLAGLRIGTTAQANADTYNVTLSIMVTLGDIENTSTEVVTRLEASAKPRSHSGHAVICTSRRTLEPRIAELLQELAGPPARR